MPYGKGFWISGDKAKLFGLGTIPDAEEFIRPYMNGNDLTKKSRNIFCLDFYGKDQGYVRDNFPDAYQHLLENVKPERDANNREGRRLRWWLFGEPGVDMREALSGLPRYIATTETAKHRAFSMLDQKYAPDQKIRVIASDEWDVLAVLSSRIHVHFSFSRGGWQGVGNDPVYQHTNTFVPFPFPHLDQSQKREAVSLGRRLDAFRKGRIEADPQITITSMYNGLERLRDIKAGAPVDPLSNDELDFHKVAQISILDEIHSDIDHLMFRAYGWLDIASSIIGRPGGVTPSVFKNENQDNAEEELLKRLVRLNAERSKAEESGDIMWIRGDFQIAKLALKAPSKGRGSQAEADLTESAAPAEKIAWPKDGLEQIKVVRAALGDADAPISIPDLDARFKGGRKRRDRLAALLAYMSETGMVREQEGDAGRRYFIPM
jgi:hypothetical protein